jgi:hypothetical protein
MNDNHECRERSDILGRIADGLASERDLDRMLQLDAIARARAAWIGACGG